MTASTLPVGPAGPAALPAHGPSRTQRFLTLMRREWLQHRIGWWVLLLAPTVLLLVLALYDKGLIDVQIKRGDGTAVVGSMTQLPALAQVMLLNVGVTLATVVLALLAIGFQMPGLARRDVQDRSIEFWRSLPTSHSQSIAATLLVHLLLLPWLALAVGALGSHLVGLVTVISNHGLAAWLTLPWPSLLAGLAALVMRGAWGLLLALLWLSPLLLLTMAASAWLKRWGLPVVAAAALAGVEWLDPRLPQAVVRPALERLLHEAVRAVQAVPSVEQVRLNGHDDVAEWLLGLPAWAARDAASALSALASPAFVAALAVAAAGFALLVWRRRVH
ncbi:hypothetical protein AACH10_18580 [Ideonella sp. DXS22W]|uniref:ABC transporter permease n=1 Tax=Pseudaquabacterium inlustre TaxID=2984192 RepID=A0ABU9CNH2_9BURK